MKVEIKLKNAEEFRRLLNKASSLSKQLEETLQQINDYKFDVEKV